MDELVIQRLNVLLTGISQRQLAKQLGYSSTYLNMVLRGVRPASKGMLEKIGLRRERVVIDTLGERGEGEVGE